MHIKHYVYNTFIHHGIQGEHDSLKALRTWLFWLSSGPVTLATASPIPFRAMRSSFLEVTSSGTKPMLDNSSANLKRFFQEFLKIHVFASTGIMALPFNFHSFHMYIDLCSTQSSNLAKKMD
jgi:hypothetical protein